jgi:hypothetical protein
MEFISKFINFYNILILVLIAILVIIYNLNKKLRKHDSQILTIEKDLNVQYEMISDLLDENDGFEIYNNNNKQNEINILPIELFPSDSELFRSELLKSKQALITIYYNNGDNERKIWNASKINPNSNILGNLRSRKEFRYRNWQIANIEKIVVEVIKNNLSNNNTSFNEVKSTGLNTIKTFDSLYKSLSIDVKAGKITFLGNTKITIRNSKILFGNKLKSQSKENMNLLFDYFIRNNINNVKKYDKDDWFSLISKLTKEKTKTIDYIYYKDFIQELLNRYYIKNN